MSSKNCYVAAWTKKKVLVRYPGGNMYYFDKTNASKTQLETMRNWGDEPKLLRWLHDQGIVAKAKKG